MTRVDVGDEMTTISRSKSSGRVKFRPGFRTRVLGFIAALLITAFSTGLVIQRAVLLDRLDEEVADALDEERQKLRKLAEGRDPSTGEPFDGDVEAIFDTFLLRNVPGEGEVYLTFVGDSAYSTTTPPGGVRLDGDPRLVQRWTALVEGEVGTIDTEAGPVDYSALPLLANGETSGVFVVANFVRNERQEIEESIRVEAFVSGLVLLLTIGAAWVIAGRLLRPVRQVTATARQITDTDLSRRLPLEGHDEIADLAATFNGMLDRLETAFSTQRSFIDDAGHELRTPIQIVRGHLELMGDSPADRAETIALVTDELDRMARMVDDLLLLAKAEQPDFVRIGSHELSDLTLELFSKISSLGERDWVLDRADAGEVRVDRDRLTQAILNLALNAVEHTSQGDRVALGSSLRPDGVRVWIADDGRGIDPAEQTHIFDRFSRGRVNQRRSEGAGLGLSIVTAIVQAHEGRIELDSALGKGARFTIVLPHPAGTLSESSLTDSPGSASPGSDSPGSNSPGSDSSGSTDSDHPEALLP